MDLVIVESPAKAKTINAYLGSGYKVLASFGHVRDLPPKDGSVDPDHDFAMAWEVSADRAKQLKEIKDAAKQAERVWLATDPDREGEAISWHLAEVLTSSRSMPKGGAKRVTFNAITKAAVTEAMGRPREVDANLVDAYRARRALDYLVGFTLSPVLWRKLPGAKSAGRVQSVALRLVVDREREIEAHRAREYWTVDADLASAGGRAFRARLVRWRGAKLDKFSLADADAAHAAKADVEASRFSVDAVESKAGTRNPAPPFTTSTLQQEASRKLGMGAQGAMRTAQSLYEAGHITYMRTDGVAMAPEAVAAARDAVMEAFGPDYVPEKPRVYSAKAKNAQEAHEAIRPTRFGVKASSLGLGGDEARLYELIAKRAMASQMASARVERTTVDLLSDDGAHGLRATGTVVLFPGFLALYAEGRDDVGAAAPDAEGEDERRLPAMRQGERPATKAVVAEQHFTEPPPRFSEASLVKRLEELGIGRPSTYASILQTLKDREYVRAEKGRFHAEDKGRLVTAFLERFFARYVEYGYTAGLEDRLDDISAGSADYVAVLRDFWEDFKPKTAEVMEQRPSDVTAALDEFLAPFLFPEREDGGDPRACTACGQGRLGLRVGKFGAFVACGNYPECRFTRPLGGGEAASDGPIVLGDDPETGLPVTLRDGRFGKFVQLGEGEGPKRMSLPRDMAPGELDLAMALKLLGLPRTIGDHPETGRPITASIGKFGPYLMHDGKYANLQTTADVFETGMNMAVARLAEPKRGRREPLAPLRVVGKTADGAEVRLMAGRFGPYVTDGVTNASLPKGAKPEELELDAALALLKARAEAAPAKGKPARKAPVKTAAAKPAAKKPAVKPVAKKPAARKPAAKKASA